MRRLIKRLGYISLFSALFATAALAWGRDESLTQTIQNSKFSVKRPNGQIVQGELTYGVTATFYVREDGNAHWPDNRSCHLVGQPSQFSRSLMVVIDGTPTILGSFNRIEESPANHDSSDNCNTYVFDNGNLLKYQRAEISDQKWQVEIASDRADVDKLLSLIGHVTYTSSIRAIVN